MEKRGQSQIITTVLIILLVLVAVIIVWNVVNSTVINSSSKIDTEILSVKAQVQQGKVHLDTAANKLQLDLTRGTDKANVSYFKVATKSDQGETIYTIDNNLPLALETRTYCFNISGLTNIKEVSVYAYSENGNPGVEQKYEIQNSDNQTISSCVNLIPKDSETTISETCNYSIWINQSCGINGCSLNEMYQTRTVISGTNCLDVQRCKVDDSCSMAGLISWWKFNGDLTDNQGLNNLINNGATTTYNVLNVNGASYARINAPTGLNIGGGDASFSVWVKTNVNDASWRAAFDYGRFTPNEFGLWKSGDTNNKFHCRFGRISTSTINSISNFEIGKWYHVVCTMKSIGGGAYNYSIYINGKLDNSLVQTPQNWAPNLSNIIIGSSSTTTEFFNGQIDDLMIYNKVLTSSEISNLFNSVSFGMTKAQYTDKVAGAWIGQFAGNFLSLSKEGAWILNPSSADFFYYPSTPVSLVSNDDHSVEYMYLNMLETYGINPSYENITQQWKDHMNMGSFWCANYIAINNTKYSNIYAPYSGNATNSPIYSQPGKEAIDAQIETEIFGAMMPNMPEKTQEFVDKISRVTADGVAVDYAEFYAILHSRAFFKNSIDDIPVIIDETQAMYSPSSRVYQVVEITKQLVNNNTNWRNARFQLRQLYFDSIRDSQCIGKGVCSWGPKCNDFSVAEINFAYTVMSLLYAQKNQTIISDASADPFGRVIELATLAGMDNDCNAASAGGVLGVIYGQSGIPDKWKNPLSANYTGITATHPGLPNSESVSSIINRTVALGEKFILSENKKLAG
ncbi:MAG: LamG-like jellyroll fold domain-containing protein [Candidatus Pacearchaeota archaeon]